MAAYQIPCPNPMNCTGDLANNWSIFRESFEDYATATGLINQPANIQVATLKSILGEECKQILRRLNLPEADLQDSLRIRDALQAHFAPERNILYERFLFYTADQQQSEKVDQYFIRLRQLAAPCKFLAMEDEMVRDRLILGCKDKSARARLFREPVVQVDLTRSLELLRISEATQEQLTRIDDGGMRNLDVNEIDKVDYKKKSDGYKFKPRKPNQAQDNIKRSSYPIVNRCKYCGGEHSKQREACPAYGKKCHACGMLNHFQTVCRQKLILKNNRQIHHVQESEQDSEEGDSLYKIEQIATTFVEPMNQMFYTRVKFNENTTLNCQMDTGASCNVISFSDYCEIMQDGDPQMHTSDAKLRLYDGTIIPVLGECSLTCEKGSSSTKLNFKIVPGKQHPLLSGKTCVSLGLLNINVVNQLQLTCNSLVEDLIAEFKDVFSGLGCLEGEYNIATDPKITPVQHVPRRVPVALREEIFNKLQEMENKSIITKVTTPTPWISSMVAVQKPGKLRICIDPRDLNKAILRPKYPIPTLDDILPLLAKARVFSVLDAKDGFHQVRLSEQSSFLTTFWTPFGRYRYLRMPFGISSAPEEWQRRMHEIFGNLPGVASITDDILVYGSGDTDEEAHFDHDNNLKKAFLRAREKNVKLNFKKLRLRLQEVRYMGQLLTKEGLRPDPLKIEAIKAMPKPDSKKSVQRLLGCVNYLSRFLPKLSEVCEPLRVLTEKETLFTWDTAQEESFDTICKLLSEAPVLRFYNLKEEVTLQCDASDKGLGAVLLQNGQPVTFASKALNQTEQCYAQIEKECLSILFACKRFDQFLHGKELITVETDHKPLIPIFKKPLHNAPKRLQRMLLNLQKYNLSVKFKPGKEMVIADMLSRAVPIKDRLQCSNNELTLAPEYDVYQLKKEENCLNGIQGTDPTAFLRISKEGLKSTKEKTDSDEELQALKEIVLSGWPDTKDRIPINVREFWSYRDEITTDGGLLFKGQQVIIPKSQRAEIMNYIHSSHLGAESCIRRARDVVFWPSMISSIKDKVSTCNTCNTFLAQQQKEPLKPYPIPERRWELIGQDLFTYQGVDYLVTVDYFSDFWEIDKLCNKKAETIVSCTKAHFARYGIPNTVITDNGPEFIGESYENFATQWGFKHNTRSPYHSQSNGKVEAAIKIAETLLKKSIHAKQDFQLAILSWRNTPQKEGSSPVQKLMSRRTRTLIPTANSLFKPAIVKNVPNIIQERQKRAKQQYDKQAKELSPLKVGDTVRVQPVRYQKEWERGTVTAMTSAPRSYIVQTETGKVYRRNRRFLKATKEDPIKQTSEVVKKSTCSSDRSRSSTYVSIPIVNNRLTKFQATTRTRKLPDKYKEFVMY